MSQVEFNIMFIKKTKFLSRTELAMLYQLKLRLPGDCHIFSNTRIADVLQPEIGEKYKERLYAILPKHVDFLICDRYGVPKCAIELNGDSHNTPKQKGRDREVKEMFAQAGLPLEFVNVGTRFEDAAERAKSYLAK